MFNPTEGIGFQCSLTFRAFFSALERRLEGMGVSRGQFVALAHLVALGPMPQAELASYLAITPACVVRLIDRMERDGWVTRTPDPKDRRVKIVSPTSSALEMWDKLSAHAQAVLKQAYGDIPGQEIEQTVRTLIQIRRNLGSE
ncbi:MAG TPA: MarR family transcriptional regulator [Acidobacteriota bacterium]|nr:MarR family transcriptional regulator [Acidobacteriota bacterium]